MEIYNIQKQTFDEMINRFESLLDRIESLCNENNSKNIDQWLDGQDVCKILSISSRTLQTYRDTGKISFSQINHKIYYRTCDVERFINENNIKRNDYENNNKKR